MPSRRYEPLLGTRASHSGPGAHGQNHGYGRLYWYKPVGDIAAALGCQPTNKDKVYLTVHEIVSFGIVERPKGQPKVTVEEVIQAVNDLGLRHHAVRDDQLVYDPIPIRVYLTVPPVPMAEVVQSYDGIHHHIASVVRGRVKPGHPDRLPTQHDLAREFRVSLHTIHKAMKLLADEGVVIATRRGTFAAPRKA